MASPCDSWRAEREGERNEINSMSMVFYDIFYLLISSLTRHKATKQQPVFSLRNISLLQFWQWREQSESQNVLWDKPSINGERRSLSSLKLIERSNSHNILIAAAPPGNLSVRLLSSKKPHCHCPSSWKRFDMVFHPPRNEANWIEI